MLFPISWVRQQYPALQASNTIYLDNAAGSQVPQQVINNLVHAMTRMQVNKGGVYRESQSITTAKERVRAQVAEFLNAESPNNIIFGANATTLVELLAHNFGRTLSSGDEIIITGLDHHANRDPWRRLSERGIVIKEWQPEGGEATLRTETLESLLTDRTRLVAMSAASNALGTLTDVAVAARVVHAAGALIMADAVHYAPHKLPDVQAMGVDMLVYSPYKVFAPHAGILYLNDTLMRDLPHHGLEFFPAADPINWESGTQNHEAIFGVGGSFEYLDDLAKTMNISGDGRDAWAELYRAFEEHEQALLRRMLEGLQEVGATVYGVKDPLKRTATVSFNLRDYPARQVAERLAERNVAVSSGHYYAYGLMMRTLGLEARGGAVRASVLHYNNQADVEGMLEGLKGM